MATAQQEADQANQAATRANNALSVKQTEIDKLNAQLRNLQDMSKNSIDLVDINKFKQAYADYLADGKLNDADIAYVKSAGEKNEFVGSEADEKNMVDVNNISSDQLKELALFTSDLLSKVRNQLGAGDDQVTQGAIDFAEKVAKRYVEDFKSGAWKPGWHDATGINDVSKNNGLDYSTKKDGSYDDVWQPYEDKSETWLSNPVSMNVLKQNIYDNLRDMIIPSGSGLDHPGAEPTYEMAHTRGLLGINGVSKEVLINTEKAAEAWLAKHPNGTYRATFNGKTYENHDIKKYVDSVIEKNRSLCLLHWQG
ncbi:SEC10/PgrA surface exclusion domain-containing protein [Lactobacillus kefiranofaciens]|uniref:SEC10/PgrA surface exclusion domain-containing protein n=1 Tax=Lactobacillus kefiranofaciens TaxID=267818 RepID=A0AAX3UGF4_9LACO|nr:SEC10/PgrA surface exclusion domain-containing protein [Lactobacillus kefiranofaciens]AEG39864.1 LPXTG-motif cell wall anchor domain protein [Lactobacillus kefiranofaciens subsp. kefiranofaciens]KRM20724.1 LPXTG-motif cell wall anchor domain-containing protein [Lactobacillus kefiranofaciens subsp. kefiranofaciens DSM 5016 = JCM 6985]QFQ67471.1 SEC10/PgrA surface exclusion domain-containing protein [Lactobacillus kefiranofaciens subsp. kefiranofaciens]WGO86790.1 SEC10/PgrA surface exclusion d